MMFKRFFRRPNPGHDLALIGHEQRRRSYRETAQQIRVELGLGEDRRLA